jgi:hypothetical protein
MDVCMYTYLILNPSTYQGIGTTCVYMSTSQTRLCEPAVGFSGWERARFSKVVINAFDYMHCTIAARIHVA